jgi:glycosyltransferase involved in cell wall biosynthesis
MSLAAAELADREPRVDVRTVVIDAFPGEDAARSRALCAQTLLGAVELYRVAYGREPAHLVTAVARQSLTLFGDDFETVIVLPPRAFPIAGVAALLAILDAGDVEPDGLDHRGWWGASTVRKRRPTQRRPMVHEIADSSEATDASGFVILPEALDARDLTSCVAPPRLRETLARLPPPSRRYRFGYFSNGVPFDRIARELYLEALADGHDFGDPGDAYLDGSFYRWLSAPAPLDRRVSRYLHRVSNAGRAAATHTAWLPARFVNAADPGEETAGVNVVGLLRSELGIGEAGRSMVEALGAAGEQVAMLDISAAAGSQRGDTRLRDFARRAPFSTSLLCVNPPEYDHFNRSAAAHAFEDRRYRIGMWWWELSDFPTAWHGGFRFLDELWVGSRFIEQTMRPVSPVPVTYVPPIVELPAFDTARRAEFGLSEDETIVLFVFDFNSVWQRKNPDGAVEAFQRAFHRAEPVRLVLKTINAGRHPDQVRRLRKMIDDDRRITWIDGYFDRLAVVRLVDVCDVYLSLHRSEGFGLTIAEAMLLRKPVVVTNWSGNTDFTKPDNCFPVDAPLAILEEDYGPYMRGSRWAEPCVDHAAAQLRAIIDDPELAGYRASRGCYDIRAKFSRARVAGIVRHRLDRIRATSGAA